MSEDCKDCGTAMYDLNDEGVCPICADDDFLTGVTCNPDAPEECESCT